MQELIQYVVDQFAENKDEVEIITEEKENSIVVRVILAASDMGKVIGKQGKIAKALRTLVRAATPKNSKKYVIEIEEKGGNTVDTDADEN
ncbi:MAG: KH domain-containing protein [Clostridia bacterium]|nr:KH domain-containing protein [Clostridia bacterium]MBR7099984.1 KH domain-containing protein [Clostridia bacterium]